MKYVALKTLKIASKGYERKNYNLVEGEAITDMDAKTLAHCCKAGYVQKGEAKAIEAAPEQKEEKPKRKRKSKKKVADSEAGEE